MPKAERSSPATCCALHGEGQGPFPAQALEKMRYDAATGSVIYRSKMHLGLKRNFQVMPGAAWLELLCKHIPDRTTITWCVKKTPRRNRGAGKRLLRVGVWNRLLGNRPIIPLKTCSD